MHHTCNNKNDLKVGIDFQCSMNMVPKCRAQFMHNWIPAVLSARTRDCRRRPDLIARAENHNSTQPGCHVASRTRSTDLQKMTWYFRSFPVRGYFKIWIYLKVKVVASPRLSAKNPHTVLSRICMKLWNIYCSLRFRNNVWIQCLRPDQAPADP